MWRNLKQLAKEFWLPALMAAAWTSIVVGARGKYSDYIAHFSGSFFFSSWLTGQYNRVHRSHEVRDSFQILTDRIEKMGISIETFMDRIEKIGISIETVLRWSALEADKPRNSPPSVATPKAMEKTEAVASKDKKRSGAQRDGNRGAGNIIDLAAYRMQRRHPQVVAVLEQPEPVEPALPIAA